MLVDLFDRVEEGRLYHLLELKQFGRSQLSRLSYMADELVDPLKVLTIGNNMKDIC